MGKPKSKNYNCLEGVRCPNRKCKQEDRFRIAGTAMFSVTDDGTDEFGDVTWDETSLCICVECLHTGKLGEFYTANQKGGKKPPPKDTLDDVATALGFSILGIPPQPEKCKGCGDTGSLDYRTMNVNGKDCAAWVCDACGHAHIPKGGK